MSSGSQFVVAAYAVILFVIVLYMVVVGMKSARIAREVELLSRLVDRATPDPDTDAAAAEPPAPVEAAEK